MGYHIKSIDLLVREINPPRMDFAIGKGQSLFPEWMRVNIEVRLHLQADDGRTAFGCSADWPSFGWLDKRPTIDPRQKFLDLLQLISSARDAYLDHADFETPFECWWQTLTEFVRQQDTQESVPLCVSFSLALIERALIDAVCRIEGMSFHTGLLEDRLGFLPDRVHPELHGFDWKGAFPNAPLETIHLRHTVGPNDPLTADDIEEGQQLTDGLPHTLEDYLGSNGITFFKIKICGNRVNDLDRLVRIWNIIQSTNPTITLDGNEAYDDVSEFRDFVRELAERLPEMFACITFIEQPMSRAMTFDDRVKPVIQEIAQLKPLIIDEADGYLHAFSDSTQLGYQGTSHKNCKGVFKSLANHALCEFRNQKGEQLFLSAEDLTSLPMVAVQQDFAVISAMGLKNAERNGHHFFSGLSHLSEQEKEHARTWHAHLYEERNGNLFLKIEQGQVNVKSLIATSGMGVVNEPDWSVMTPLDSWIEAFRAAPPQ